MAGIDDNVAVFGDYNFSPNPSPRTLFSSLLGDNISSKPFPDVYCDIGLDRLSQGPEKQKTSKDNEVASEAFSDCLSGLGDFLSGDKSSSRGGLAERRAARAGFTAPRLNTATIRSSNVLGSSSPEALSAYLTISPGLSPATLLPSPVFIPNSLVQPSPTTGKFPLSQFNSKSSMTNSAVPDKDKDHLYKDAGSESFVFKPQVETGFSNKQSMENRVASVTNHQQSFPGTEVSVQSEPSVLAQKLEAEEVHRQSQEEFFPCGGLTGPVICKGNSDNDTSDLKACNSLSGNAKHAQISDDQELEEDQKELSMAAPGAQSEDGYNWRKYGQKQVKGSEYPRSYYKCTHPNCPVKKKVERSHEGHITEIVYKGAHNHPKPPPNRRAIVGSSYLAGETNGAEQPTVHLGFDGEQVWVGSQRGGVSAGSNWTHDDMETASSASAATELGEPSTSAMVQNGSQFESGDAMDVSSTVSNNDDEDDRRTHGSASVGYDEDGDESESKRRKIDASVMEMTGATRAIREPRVVVQTTSEVDILDDGYRWRKYGQKVVKGNPNPRSYYKCTSAGCTVRKHVERASHDLKSVITTYEGKHNHDVPAARNSSHVSSGSSAMSSAAAVQAHIPRPEPSQMRDGMARFDTPVSLHSFGLPGRQSLGPSPNFAFGLNQPGLANLAMAGYGPGHGKLPALPVHSYFGQRKMNDVPLMMPKGELKEEPLSEPTPTISNGSLYHQIFSRLPLGPQL